MSDLKIEGSIAKLCLSRGDVLVVKIDDILSNEMCSSIRALLRDYVPDGVKIMVLQRGIELSVLSAKEEQEGRWL